MFIKQLSVFLENKPGYLRKVTSILKENNINIRALNIADSSAKGEMRLIVEQPNEVEKLLKEKNLIVRKADVIGVEMDDTPGGLDEVLRVLESMKINVEYMYAFMGAKYRKALVIFSVDKIEEAITVLQEGNIKLITSEKEVDDLIYYCWD